MKLPPDLRPIAATLRRFVRRATADYAFRIRHRDGLFELHERSGGAWRVRGCSSATAMRSTSRTAWCASGAAAGLRGGGWGPLSDWEQCTASGSALS